MIAAILPAHNEADGITAALHAVAPQVDYVLVVSDNSTDNTVQVARETLTTVGVPGSWRVMETTGNTARKAGALNQAIASLTPHLTDGDLLLPMDADTVLTEGWVERALTMMAEHDADAAGAVFHADSDRGWLRQCQANEWVRFEEEICRTGKTFVLSGTASLIRWEALERVRVKRGSWYDERAICEDFRLTVDLYQTGARLTSGRELLVTTETMPTVPDLFRQRRRWSLGALQVCTRSGVSPVMFVYWRQQVLLLVGILALWAYLALTIYGVATSGPHLSPFWTLIGLAFVLERVVTVWDAGLRARIFAALIVPEIVYAIILQVAHVGAIVQFITGSNGQWHHVKK